MNGTVNEKILNKIFDVLCRIEKQLKFMEDNPLIDVCGAWVQLIGKYNGIAESEAEDSMIKIKLLTNQNLSPPTVMIRMKILKKHDLLVLLKV